ncbi:hypothetical protein D9619_009897 [Psilocybe cf. subviscida]|uniref:Uncharacterized protein n=1 Tax=Psilocybe cf. subviscida TaxID=2480587 RepID=A0A8H5F6I4_9AGAR|nr:hypothetical protein D9619_009897 [Psilocybe cf. subviscida]
MAKQPLNLEARRVRMVIVALPILVASSWVMYKRIYWGEEQRQLPTRLDENNRGVRLLDRETPEERQ